MVSQESNATDSLLNGKSQKFWHNFPCIFFFHFPPFNEYRCWKNTGWDRLHLTPVTPRSNEWINIFVWVIFLLFHFLHNFMFLCTFAAFREKLQHQSLVSKLLTASVHWFHHARFLHAFYSDIKNKRPSIRTDVCVLLRMRYNREGSEAAKKRKLHPNGGSREYEKVLEMIAFTISGFVQAENRSGLGIVLIKFGDRCAEDRQEMFSSSVPVSAYFCTKALEVVGGMFAHPNMGCKVSEEADQKPAFTEMLFLVSFF